MTRKEFVNRAMMYKGHPYMYGTFGKLLTRFLADAKYKQYPSYYTAARKKVVEDLLKNGMQHYPCDCVGLIKAALWGFTLGGAIYNVNQDVSANGMLKLCKSGKYGTFKVRDGDFVFCSGHVGIVVNTPNLQAIPNDVLEASIYNYKVAINKRPTNIWTHSGTNPFVSDAVTSESTPQAMKVGAKVKILANAKYGHAHDGMAVPKKYRIDGGKYTDTIDRIDGEYVRVTGLYSWIAKKYLEVI